MLIDKDRLSHWIACVVFGWSLYCLVLGIPVFHWGLGVSTIRVVSCFAGVGLLQLAVTPWIFWARPTSEEPDRRFAHRIGAVTVWIASTLIFLLHFLQYGKAIDAVHIGERVLLIGVQLSSLVLLHSALGFRLLVA